jgi:transposase InsO family protein
MAEIALIHRLRKENPFAGLVVFWVILLKAGYQRNISTLYRFMRRDGMGFQKPKNPKRVSKKYEDMTRPGERVQVDVKVVPKSCIEGGALVRGDGWFQYTAIDEYSRFRYVEGFEEQNGSASAQFLDHLVKAFPFKIECIQTDNGTEFTNRFVSTTDKPSTFDLRLAFHEIRHKLIKPYTPRHNGKVERSHRKDNERFYALNTFSSFADFRNRLARYNWVDYNDFPMRPLKWKSPLQTLRDFLRLHCNT